MEHDSFFYWEPDTFTWASYDGINWYHVTPTSKLLSGPWMDHLLPLVYIWGDFFWHPIYVCVMYGIGQCHRIFSSSILVHSWTKYFFRFHLWYWIQLCTTKYSNLILISFRYWINGNTYSKGKILKQIWYVNRQIFSLLHEMCMALGLGRGIMHAMPMGMDWFREFFKMTSLWKWDHIIAVASGQQSQKYC